MSAVSYIAAELASCAQGWLPPSPGSTVDKTEAGELCPPCLNPNAPDDHTRLRTIEDGKSSAKPSLARTHVPRPALLSWSSSVSCPRESASKQQSAVP